MDRRIERLDKPVVDKVSFVDELRRPLIHLMIVICDALLIVVGFALAHWLRYDLQLGRDIYDPSSYRQLSAFYPRIAIFVVLLIAALHMRGFYRLPRYASIFDYVGIIVSSTTIAIALLIMWQFVTMADVWSRLIMVFVWLAVIVVLITSRFALRALRRWNWKRGHWLQNVIVVGNRGLARQVMDELQYSVEHGHRLAGYVEGPPDDRDVIAPNEKYPILGNVAHLQEILQTTPCEEVIVALPFWMHTHLPEIVKTCRDLNIDFRIAPDLYELSFDRVSIQRLSTMPLLRLKKNIIRGWNYVFKRTLDLALTLITLPIWGLILGIAALLIKLSDWRAPVVFSQPRVGKNREQFIVYKLRTMIPGADAMKDELRDQNEAEGALFKIKDDPRITKLGKIFRKLSIDELPQLYNVLRGDMSLVGPRPQVPDEVEQYEAWHYRRLEVPPGVTGLWQATGRSNTTFDDMVRLDIYYTEHWSLWLDVRILVQTIPAVLLGRGAY